MATDFSDIVCTEHVLGGSPRLNGRRLAVGDVVSSVCGYGTLVEVLKDYELNYQQVQQALHYCATQQCKADKPLLFCHNCTLRYQQDGPLDTSDLEEIKSDTGVMVRGEGLVFFGTIEEFLSDYQGRDWWLIASDLLIDLRKELFGGTDHN